MLKTPIVHMGLFCALLCTTAWTVSAPVLAGPAPNPLANDSNDGLPTMGGSSAFATKADAMVSTVENFIQRKDYESAETAAAELTREYPGHVKGWLLLGFCQSRTKKFEASNDSYKHALTLGAEEKTVLLRQAYNHVRLGEYDTARLSYKTILETNYEDTDALGQLAYLEGKRIIPLVDFAKEQKLSHSNLLNKANRQTIEAFWERGKWKIGV